MHHPEEKDPPDLIYIYIVVLEGDCPQYFLNIGAAGIVNYLLGVISVICDSLKPHLVGFNGVALLSIY